ncbi:armadillo-type protein [Tribonema minus]|uniref:Armadillo-type protein n=1 Tax=Tribonema minus TaxID=303371 RepID=A0A835YZD7_9STRA|nr:armadillo-type protein [Tribonema minus]
MDLPTLLANCQNPDANVRKSAEDALAQAAQQDLGQLMLALVGELTNEQQQEILRQQAGMYVKLLLSAGDDAIRERKLNDWERINLQVKSQIKAGVLQTLHSQVSATARHTAALVIGKMGAIDLPKNMWPEMLQQLLNNVTGQATEGTKVSSLEALGYMCDEWEPQDMDQQQTNQILTCIVDGIRADRPNSVRLAAVQALLNSLDFTSANFETQAERDMLMRVICEATQSTDTAVRRVAYECISSIASMYYSKLQPYMEVLFQLTLRTIKEDEVEVALQALEFWSALCDEELEIKDAVAYLEDGEKPERECAEYVKLALPHLTPLLLECLTKQEEESNEDDWGIAEAGGTCLQLAATVVGDEVVDQIVPFVTANIQNENWRQREAAVMAFGAVLEGPSPDKLSPLVRGAMPVLLTAMRDSTSDYHVLIYRRCCLQLFPTLVENLVQALSLCPKVAARASYALHMFAEASEGQRDAPSNAISPYFSVVVQKLLQVIMREDWADDNLRVSGTEAMNMLIQNSADDVRPVVVETLKMVLNMLAASFNMPLLSNDDREKQQGLQSLLCGTIQVICPKIKQEVAPYGDQIMTLLLKVFGSKHAIAQEEAFMAAGALADQLERDFAKYMNAFAPILVQGLSNHEEYQVCIVAVGVVGDLCRALDTQMLQYSDEIVRCLLHNLQNPTINRHVKPPVLACLGDIALAVGGGFDKYVDVTVNMLLQAQTVCSSIPPDEDEDMVDYINQLRESILEAYSGIIQGLNDNGAQKAGMLLQYLPGIVQFLEALAPCDDRDDTVLRHAIGVVGDLAHAIGAPAAPHLKGKMAIHNLLEDGMQSPDIGIKEVAQWANTNLRNL